MCEKDASSASSVQGKILVDYTAEASVKTVDYCGANLCGYVYC